MDMFAFPKGTRPVNWDGVNLPQLLGLDPVEPRHWRSHASDINVNGKTYGGQLLGQTIIAAMHDIAPQRQPRMLHCLFLQSADPQENVDFHVSTLQEGKRFSSRSVTALQASGRRVLEAQLSCAVPMEGPEHVHAPSTAPQGEQPQDLPTPQALVDAFLHGKTDHSGAPDPRFSIDMRVPDAFKQLMPQSAQPRFRYWIRAHNPLPDDPVMRMAAFAYLSDWGMNFSALIVHQAKAQKRRVYLSSLNHTMWLHHPVFPNQWLHVESVSAAAAQGVAISYAHIHDQEGRLIANVSQQSLMTFPD